jgi:hypothetical protein
MNEFIRGNDSLVDFIPVQLKLTTNRLVNCIVNPLDKINIASPLNSCFWFTALIGVLVIINAGE